MFNGHVCQLDGSWGGCWASPDPPGPASVFARSIRQTIRKSANYARILPVGTSQTGAVYILGDNKKALSQELNHLLAPKLQANGLPWLYECIQQTE